MNQRTLEYLRQHASEDCQIYPEHMLTRQQLATAKRTDRFFHDDEDTGKQFAIVPRELHDR